MLFDLHDQLIRRVVRRNFSRVPVKYRQEVTLHKMSSSGRSVDLPLLRGSEALLKFSKVAFQRGRQLASPIRLVEWLTMQAQTRWLVLCILIGCSRVKSLNSCS